MPSSAIMTVALTIAGSDPSGGAGLQADLKTFHQHAVYGTSVVTLLTVQNTQTVAAVQSLAAEFVLQQLDGVMADVPPNAAKTGALGSGEVIEAVAERSVAFSFPLVVDPVMISKHGAPLLDASAVEAVKRRLLPRAFLVTPNLHEAAVLSGRDVSSVPDMEAAAEAISDMGAENVLVKGGHLAEEPLDLLYSAGEFHRFANRRIDTPHTHGTGCVFSAAITARLARGEDIVAAVAGAKRFITAAIETNPGLGKGFGPTNMFAPVD
jgi:hydroxymethylpyrimidine/phosphomethylpyrimidine kinase